MTVPMNRVAGGVGIAAIWVMLFGEVTAANVLGGAAVSVVVVLVFRPRRRGPRHRVSPWGVVVLLAHLAAQLVVSSCRVALAVLRPTPARVQTEVVRVPMATDSEVVGTIVADLITLTPGTLTLDVRHDPEQLFVHALGAADPDGVRASVQGLEKRVLRAVAPEPASGSPNGEGGRR